MKHFSQLRFRLRCDGGRQWNKSSPWLLWTAASLTAIGAFEQATVVWFDFEKKTYKKIEIAEQCEVLSAIGDVAVGDDEGRRPRGTEPEDSH